MAVDDLIDAEDDVAVAAITAAELLVGAERADEARRARRAKSVEDVLATLAVEPYDLGVAREHAVLLAATRGVGRPRGAHDLIIAATARACDRIVISADRTAFTDLPGVRVRLAGP